MSEYAVAKWDEFWYVTEKPARNTRLVVAGPYGTKVEAEMVIPAKAKTIKQDELQSALNARLVVETLKRQLKEAEDERDRIELVLVSRIKKGDPVANGELSAVVQPNEGKRNVKWKEEFAQLAGPEQVEAVIERTPKTPGEDKLVISSAGRVTKTA